MRICSGPGCLRAVADSVRFCDECKPSTSADNSKNHTSGYDAKLDELRTSQRWQRLRKSVLAAQPICKRCDRKVSEIVDHIVPAREAVAQAQISKRFFDRYAGYFLRSNLQGLCRSCHWTKTAEDKTHVGAWPNVVEVEDAAPKRVYTF